MAMSDSDANGTPKEDSPPEPATGCGPNASGQFSQKDYHHPAVGIGKSWQSECPGPPLFRLSTATAW